MIEAAETAGLISPAKRRSSSPPVATPGSPWPWSPRRAATDLVLTMPETMSLERRVLLSAYGAELVLTPGAGACTAPMQAPRELADERPAGLHAAAVREPRQPRGASRDDRPGDLARHGRRVDVFVAAVGTGGTVTGAGEVLKGATRRPGGGGGAGRVARPLRRAGGPAQDPGHRRRLRPGGPRHIRVWTRSSVSPSDQAFEMARDLRATKACWSASPPAPMLGRRRGGPAAREPWPADRPRAVRHRRTLPLHAALR